MPAQPRQPAPPSASAASAAETLTGTNGANLITGNAGNDAPRGPAGDGTDHSADGWGQNTLEKKRAHRVGGKTIPGDTDTLSFRGVKNCGVGAGPRSAAGGTTPRSHRSGAARTSHAVRTRAIVRAMTPIVRVCRTPSPTAADDRQARSDADTRARP